MKGFSIQISKKGGGSHYAILVTSGMDDVGHTILMDNPATELIRIVRHGVCVFNGWFKAISWVFLCCSKTTALW